MATYRLHSVWIMLALCAGAAVGAGVIALVFNLPYLFQAWPEGMFPVLMTFIVAWVLWAVGLGVIGGPLWGLAERARLRSLHHAVVLGFIATFVAAAFFTLLMDAGGLVSLILDGKALVRNGRRTPYGLWVLARDSGLFALLGALVAVVIWRIAYRREAAQ